MNVFPARRTRELLGLVGLGAVGVLVLFLRFMRPEQLARPEGFQNFVDYLVALQTPTSACCRASGRSGMIMNWLLRVADPAADRAALGRGAGRARCRALVHKRLFRLGYSKAQEGAERKVRRPLRGAVAGVLMSLPGHEARVPAQGHAAVLPGQLPVEPADPAGGAADGLPLQHQRAADPLGRAGSVQPGDHHLVPQPRPRRLRAGGGRGAVHLPGRVARGAADVAAPLEPARSHARCSGASTGSAPCRCSCWRSSSRCSPTCCSR